MAGKVNQVLLALTALWQSAPALTGVQVLDGPQATLDASLERLFAGFDGGNPGEAPAVTLDQSWMAFAKTMQEEAQVTCAVIVRNGSADLPTARARAYSLLSSAEDSVRSDPTLGGVVRNSWVSRHEYIPAVGKAGARARVVFTVTYQAQI